MDKYIKYKAICPICGKPFDSIYGFHIEEKLLCPICYAKRMQNDEYLPLDDYDNDNLLLREYINIQ